MTSTRVDAGSYRDPSGRIYFLGDRVYRTVMPVASEDFDFVRSSGALEPLIDEGLVIAGPVVDHTNLEFARGASYVIEHPRLPFVSYPYEWCFSALKSAALLHLDVHLRVLESDVTLSDASAYNIQFQSGSRPIFIDWLSFRRYREGEFWIGHRQFCEQFLNPLLLRSLVGVPHNAWYRGSLEGITTVELSRLLPRMRKLSWNVLTHVVLQAAFQKGSASHRKEDFSKKAKLGKPAFQRILTGLRKWISRLEPRDRDKTVWTDYADEHSYKPEDVQKKQAFIAEFVQAARPELIWDIGCNTGDYSLAALAAGARLAVGFDSDQSALDKGFARAQSEGHKFLPLFLDAANPTPSQGWGETERMGLRRRAGADGLLALALVHHLAISRNVPLDRLVGWLVDLAPSGIVEFVPKADAMVQELLRLREDIFDDYSVESFERTLRSHAEVVKSVPVSDSGRRLFWFRRHDSAPPPER